MNPRLKYILLFIIFAGLTYGSTLLYEFTSGKGAIDIVAVILTFTLGIVSFFMLVKIFNPRMPILQMIGDFLTGL